MNETTSYPPNDWHTGRYRTCLHSHCTKPAIPGSDRCAGHPRPLYRPLPENAAPPDMLAHALQYGVGGLDGQELRRLDTIAQTAAYGYGQKPEPHQLTVLETLSQLRHRIAAEQLRRTQAWARIAAQLAGQETDPDQDQEIADQEPQPQETDADRAAKLLRAALMLIMGPQGGPSNGNGGGGRPVRPIRPGPTTPPQDGRALTLPTAPVTNRRGDDEIQF